MIPLDVVGPSFKEKQEMPRDEANVIGKLSDFGHSDYDRLSAFLFSRHTDCKKFVDSLHAIKERL